MSEAKSEYIPIRVTPTLRAAIEEAARADERDVSEWIRLTVQRELVRRKTKDPLDNVSQRVTIDT